MLREQNFIYELGATLNTIKPIFLLTKKRETKFIMKHIKNNDANVMEKILNISNNTDKNTITKTQMVIEKNGKNIGKPIQKK